MVLLWSQKKRWTNRLHVHRHTHRKGEKTCEKDSRLFPLLKHTQSSWIHKNISGRFTWEMQMIHEMRKKQFGSLQIYISILLKRGFLQTLFYSFLFGVALWPQMILIISSIHFLSHYVLQRAAQAFWIYCMNSTFKIWERPVTMIHLSTMKPQINWYITLSKKKKNWLFRDKLYNCCLGRCDQRSVMSITVYLKTHI